MDRKQGFPKTLQATALEIERRAEEIRVQRGRIDAARMRLWERMDRLRQMEPRVFSAPPIKLLIPVGEPAGAAEDVREMEAPARDPLLLALAEAERTLAELAAEAAG